MTAEVFPLSRREALWLWSRMSWLRVAMFADVSQGPCRSVHLRGCCTWLLVGAVAFRQVTGVRGGKQ
jgi:hypothetical protein